MLASTAPLLLRNVWQVSTLESSAAEITCAKLSMSFLVRSFLIWFFPTLAVGLLDFKVDVVLAQPQGIPAVPNCKVSLQWPTNEYPCNA